MDGNLSKGIYQLTWIAGNFLKIHSFVDIVLDKIEVFQKTLILIGIDIEIVLHSFEKLQFSKGVKHHSNVWQ